MEAAEVTHHALALGAALVAAYVFLRTSHYHRFTTEHLRTDRFALHLFAYAAAFVAAGAFIGDQVPDFAPKALRAMAPEVEPVGITPTTVNAVLVAFIAGQLSNLLVWFRMRKDPAVQQANRRSRIRLAAVSLYIRESNDSFQRTLFRALILKKLVMMTLKNSQVYVGLPLFSPDGDPTKPFTSIRIYPIASGVRERDSKRVTFRTNYSDFSKALEPIPESSSNTDNRSDVFISSPYHVVFSPTDKRKIDIEDMGIVITWDQVISMTLFDSTVYNLLQPKPDEEPEVSSRPHKSWLRRRMAKHARGRAKH